MVSCQLMTAVALLLLPAKATGKGDEIKSAGVVQPQPPPIECSSPKCTEQPRCLSCRFPNCTFGRKTEVVCEKGSLCDVSEPMTVTNVTCRYCYQTESWEQQCVPNTNCSVVSSSSVRYVTTTCWVKDHVHCMGRRAFYKRIKCSWTSGYRWSTAFFLSVTLGGFGVDRFYLGAWKSAIGKLFSFGGLGVWTVVDVILIGVGYVGPADGSLYI